MHHYRILTACALAMASLPALADTTTFSGSGNLTAFPGYGYQYLVTIEASAGTFTFTPSVTSRLGTTFPSTMTFSGTGSAFVVGVDTFDLVASMQLRFVNTLTGAEALPPVFQPRQQTAIFSASNTVTYSGFDSSGVAFSYPTSNLQSSAPGRNDASTTLYFGVTQHVVAGHFLNPSSGGTCASFACMVPGTDNLAVDFNFNASYSTEPVPEPHVLALMAFGLAVVGVRWRRRSSDIKA